MDRVDTGGQNFFSLTFPDFFLRKETFFPDHTNEKYIIFPDQSTFYISKLYVFGTTIGVVYSRCANPPFVLPWEVHTMQNPGSKSCWIWNYLGLEKTRCLRRPYHIHMLILHHLSLVPKKIFLQTNTSLSQKARK